MLKAIIWDMDGVIVDTEPLHREAYYAMFEESTIHGTILEVSYHEEGQLTGFGGCNTFTGSYASPTLYEAMDPITIKIDAITRKLCNEPEGIMEQEQTFLETLGEVEKYKFRSDGRMMLLYIVEVEDDEEEDVEALRGNLK